MCQDLQTFKKYDMWNSCTLFGFKYMSTLGIWWKKVISSKYFQILRPIYKPYDYNFNRTNFKHKKKIGHYDTSH
jgi:hypothetical protein